MPFTELIKHTHLIDRSTMPQWEVTHCINYWGGPPKTGIIIVKKSSCTKVHHLYFIDIALRVGIPYTANIRQYMLHTLLT